MGNNTGHKSLSIKLLVLFSYGAMIVVNAMAILLPINGISAKEISNLYPNLFTPAPYTFGIWSVIYLALGGFVFYQFKAPHKETGLLTQANLMKIRVAFIFSCLFNSLWIFAWHYQKLGASLLLMVMLLVTLIYINRLTRTNHFPRREKFLLRSPFSIYFGWITVATIVNITVLLVNSHWQGFYLSPVFWTVLILFVGIVICMAVVLLNRDSVYGLAVLWAYGGILANHLSAAGFDGQYYSILIMTVTCMVLLFIAVVVAHLARD